VRGAVAWLSGVHKVYGAGSRAVHALRGVSLAVTPGRALAIMGPSGSGKSTLLAILGCLELMTNGSYVLEGADVGDLSDEQLSRLRNRTLGFVFQSFHLIPELSVVENVEIPLLYGDVPPGTWRSRALACLEQVGLADRAEHRPTELSGGEAQRAAIARALVTEPRLLLADEPTGNLDAATGRRIADLIVGLAEGERAVVIVTHNDAVAHEADRVVRLVDGAIREPAQ